METIGIIAEYNPFHLGHAYQLSYITESWPEAIKIIVMSGSFVQRGMPALFSKFDRTKWALLGGADIVLELPAVFAVRSAEVFATAAMRLLAGLKIEAFSFGSEYTNLDLLIKIADLLNSSIVQERTRELIKSGLSYGNAQRQAISEIYAPAQDIISYPNALLGIEYLRAIQKYNMPLTPLPINRNGDYHAQDLTKNKPNAPSATALRKALQDSIKNIDTSSLFALSPLMKLQTYFPEEIGPLVTECMKEGNFVNVNRYYDLIQFCGRKLPLSEISTYGDFAEGIENRWKKAIQEHSWERSRNLIKSKRYGFNRLDRMAAYTVLGWKQEFLTACAQTGPTYARLLGFTETGRNWLRGKEGNIPVIQKWAPAFKQATGLTRNMMEADNVTTDIQSLCLTKPESRLGSLDYTYTPFYLA